MSRNSFLTNSLTLISGTVLTQLIVFLFSPLLSRFFSHAAFGTFANYNAWVAILALFSNLRYEQAIIVAHGRAGINRVIALTALLSLISFLGQMLAALIVYRFPTHFTYVREIQGIVLLIPLGVLSICLTSLLIQVNIKAGRFKSLAAIAAVQALLTVVPQVTLGVLRVEHGLILGTLAGSIFSNATFAILFLRRNSLYHVWREMKREPLLLTARHFANFPRYMLGADAITVLVQQFVPVFLLGLFDPAAAGVYSFSTRIVRVPALVVSAAIASSLRKEAVDQLRRGASLEPLFAGTVKGLLILAVVPLLVLLFFSDQLFALAFGAQWADAGRIARILSPGILAEFVAFPLSMFYLVTNRQQYTFRMQFLSGALLVAALLVGRYHLHGFIATCYLVSGVLVVVNVGSILLTSVIIRKAPATA